MKTQMVVTILILLAALTGCEPRPPLPFDPAQGIDFTADGLSINGKTFQTAPSIDELREVIGKEDRMLNLANDIYVWDELGLYAYVDPGETRVDDISIAFGRQDYDFSPKKPYPHTVRVAGCVIGSTSHMRDLTACGFQASDLLPDSCDRAVGSAHVYVEHVEGGKGVLDVSLGIEDW